MSRIFSYSWKVFISLISMVLVHLKRYPHFFEPPRKIYTWKEKRARTLFCSDIGSKFPKIERELMRFGMRSVTRLLITRRMRVKFARAQDSTFSPLEGRFSLFARKMRAIIATINRRAS